MRVNNKVFQIFNVHYKLFTIIYPCLLSYSFCCFHYRNIIAILDRSLMALIGTGAYGANLAELMWTHVHKCFWMAKYWKPKSFKQPFFDWIKITDFLIAKLIIFWEWKMTPKNSQFCYKKICNFDPIKKGLLEWFCFLIFCHPKTCMNMGSHQFSQVRAGCTIAY